VGAALLVLTSAWNAWSASSESRHALQRVEEARRETALASSRLRAIQSIPGVGREGTLARAELVATAPPVEVLAAVSELMPPKVRLESARVTYGSGVEVDLTVRARSAEAYDILLRRLAASPRFGSVSPGAERPGAEMVASVRAIYLAVGR
jgi:hypothetical protein